MGRHHWVAKVVVSSGGFERDEPAVGPEQWTQKGGRHLMHALQPVSSPAAYPRR